MRKMFAILLLGMVIVTTACADNDVITRNLNDLPVPARTILKQQFAHTKVSYIKIDKDWFKSATYDVQLVNGTEISFDSKGDWTEVDGKRSEVPAFFIPAPIKKHAVYRNYFIHMAFVNIFANTAACKHIVNDCFVIIADIL